MVKYILERLSEPSSWIALGVGFALLGIAHWLPEGPVTTIVVVGALVAIVGGFFLPESWRKKIGG